MEHKNLASELVAESHRAGGLAPVDLERFWADQARAGADPFAASQVAMGIGMSGECVWAELNEPEDWWRYETDEPFRLQLHKRYNDVSQRVVGRRLLNESPSDPARKYPATKSLADVFEAKNHWDGWSWWLMPSAGNEEELKALLDRVETCDIRKFILPENWDAEKDRLLKLGVKPPLYRWQRGPCTFATSVYGTENFLFLVMDNPDLAGRFRDAILRVMLEIGRVLDEEAGYTQATSPRGFGFADDNCALFTPDMYEFFGFPILRKIWEVYSPADGDWRYQHSDSSMAHLLPLLGKLRLRGTNFGPTVSVEQIRRYLPQAVINGQLAPFTFMRNEEEAIVTEFLRDFSQARATRGLRFTTAGSINNGSMLKSMRLVMAAIQRHGQY